MSRNYTTTAQEVANILHDVKGRTNEEVEQLYGIRFDEDGTIFDPTYNMTFTSLGDWALFSVEQDHTEFDEKFYDDYV